MGVTDHTIDPAITCRHKDFSGYAQETPEKTCQKD